ncbi:MULTISPECIES: aspartate aminotransferase family protein [unclassified Pseudomonas]|jgi:beta-alanine--pyruvate transaminase|uniref:aspartate aminotransferase family protein n=1 Tax=unclassified Pseudomonas TaxID=196821 RepID=UPI000EA92879|nr:MULTISPECIES: aspartate aminotransferase family protein [unclassified Pseudomonas]AYF89462.1 aspartate aminotransferase family protein [Pseudomonas sp. DY-1]MDH4655991.1 aspartate aminotransferase family protein [Pseudomonas sp. BN606]MRK21386.1 aspartate aminotransferase family protein [Pseudomonas sp. JG-B]
MTNAYAPQPDRISNSLDDFWMPFTANRQFKAKPRLLESAEGMYFTSTNGRQVLDGTAGLWCCNAGHGRREITEAVSKQIAKLDFAPTFQMGHPLPFELAERLADIAPKGLNKVFFTNSGSESADTALKIALAYQRAIGQGTRTRLIGRELGYHGVGFGGISVGGMVNNRKAFPALLPNVDHLPHTLDIQRNAFSRGLPEFGIEKADELERLVTLHGAENIAAVIVEPMSGSAGVILPPVGYLQRLREITRKHGILLIFDEVITGFGRVGQAFAAQRWGVTPDIITCAKGLTNGAIPMGAVFVAETIYQAFMQGPESAIEFFHGYTYSGHPVACAAALATLDIYQGEGLFERAVALEGYWQDALLSLRDLPNVIDIRAVGLVGGVQLAPGAEGVGKRGFQVFEQCFHDDLMVRVTGDTIAMSPPLIVEKEQIDILVGKLADSIRKAV